MFAGEFADMPAGKFTPGLMCSILAVAMVCLVFAISLPVKFSIYYDLGILFFNTIIWKDLLSVELADINQLQMICSDFIEWRHVPYVMAFQLFFGSLFFRYVSIMHSKGLTRAPHNLCC